MGVILFLLQIILFSCLASHTHFTKWISVQTVQTVTIYLKGVVKKFAFNLILRQTVIKLQCTPLCEFHSLQPQRCTNTRTSVVVTSGTKLQRSRSACYGFRQLTLQISFIFHPNKKKHEIQDLKCNFYI